MEKIEEEKFKEEIKAVCDRYKFRGHLLVYLDGETFKFTGNLSSSALAPLLVRALSDKFLK